LQDTRKSAVWPLREFDLAAGECQLANKVADAHTSGGDGKLAGLAQDA
jgi:hypothetical protein